MLHYKRLEYTNSDRLTILNIIIEHKCYTNLRGNRIWQSFAQKKLLPHTWQSMKEHFRKKIIQNIATFDISEKEKKLIQEGWMQSRRIRSCEDNKNIKRTTFDFDAFSDEDSPPPVARTRCSTLRNNIKTTTKLISKESVNEQTDDCVENNTDVTVLPSTSSYIKQSENDEVIDLTSSSDLSHCTDEKIIVLDSEDECLPQSNDQEGDKNVLFSEEDIHLLYNITAESPAELKRRFTNDILPNFRKYIYNSLEQMFKLYKAEGVDVPNNLKLLTQVPILQILKSGKENNSQNTAGTTNIRKGDFETSDCIHTINRISNCSFCTVILENKSHVFFNKHDAENSRQRMEQIPVSEDLYNIFWEKYNVEKCCVHHVENYNTLVHIDQLINYKAFFNSAFSKLRHEYYRFHSLMASLRNEQMDTSGTSSHSQNANNQIDVEGNSHDINILSKEIVHILDQTILLQENLNNYAESSNDTSASSPEMHKTD